MGDARSGQVLLDGEFGVEVRHAGVLVSAGDRRKDEVGKLEPLCSVKNVFPIAE